MSTSSRTWKRAEERVAATFGARRQPLSGASGRDDLTASDSTHPRLFIESKYRARHAIRSVFDRTKALAQKESKAPLLVLTDKRRPGCLLCLFADDLPVVLAEFAAGNIKVYVPITRRIESDPEREYLWARPVTPTTAKVRNIPYYTDAVSLDDLVEHEGGEIVRVVERCARTYLAAIEGDPEEARRNWPVLWDYFVGHDIYVEWCLPGLFSMAVPCDVSPDRLLEIALACPVTIDAVAPIEEHDRFVDVRA
jgi:hypothetical protein